VIYPDRSLDRSDGIEIWVGSDFSPIVVPEPGTAELPALGLLGFGMARPPGPTRSGVKLHRETQRQ
jgi:hypothetical protein